jgi:RNA polymerase sigma factor (sigma-70 family)
MALGTLSDVLRHMRGVYATQEARNLSDGKLLDRFLTSQDETAFAVLMHRHGPMVLALCRRLTGDTHAAEDAFQATFLVLARRAAAIKRKAAVASWLYGVAQRIALRAKTQMAAGRRREKEFAEMPRTQPADDDTSQELLGALDEEIGRLPEKYQAPIVLCYLEGKSHDQAARQLGWHKNSLTNRLARGRELLRKQLVGRGIALPAAGLTAALGTQASAAPVGATLMINTAKAATSFASGQAVADGFITAGALALAREAMKLALGIQAKMVLFVLIAGLAVGGAGVAAYGVNGLQDQPPKVEKGQSPSIKVDKVAPPQKDMAGGVDLLGDPLPEGALRRFGTTRFRHGNQIMAMARSPDGKTIATGGIDGEIRLWDAATGRLDNSFRMAGLVCALRYSQDGTKLVSAGSGDLQHRSKSTGQIVVWDPKTGKPIRTIAKTSNVDSAVITPDGMSIIVSTYRASLQLLDINTGKVRQDFAARLGSPRLALSPDGRMLAGGYGRETQIWDTATGAEKRQLPATDQPLCLVFSPDSKMLATAHLKGNSFEEAFIRLWDPATGAEQWSVKIGTGKSMSGGVFVMSFSPDGRQLACGGINGVTEIRDAKTGNIVRQFIEGKDWILGGVAFSPDGGTLYAAGSDGVVQVWNVATGEPHFQFDQHKGGVFDLSRSPDGKTLATAAGDGTIRLWDLTRGKTRVVLPKFDAGVSSVNFLADGKRLVSSESNGTVRIWDVGTVRELEKLAGPNKGITTRITVSPDGKLLAIGSMQQVRLWDLAAGKEIRQFIGHKGYIIDLSFSADGTYLATSAHSYQDSGVFHEDWTMRVWQIATGEELYCHTGLHPDKPLFTPDGRGVAVSTGKMSNEQERTWVVCDFITGKERPRLGWNDVQAQTLSPGGMWLATAHADGSVRIRDAWTGKEIHRFQADAGHFYRLLWSADGKKLYSAHADTTVLEWKLGWHRGRTAFSADRAWSDLASPDPAKAYEAQCWFLTAADSVALLTSRLKAEQDDGKAQRIRRLIAELDDQRFAVREAANKELTALGESAEPALKQAAAARPSLELRMRIRKLLEQLPPPALTAEEARNLRAMEVLECVGSPEARKLLEGLAKGASDARQTIHAQAARQRLGWQSDGP